MARPSTFIVLLVLSCSGLAAGMGRMHLNPIRKVVLMLQKMSHQVTEEAKKEESLYKRFMCYCKTSGGDLEKSIEAAKTKLPDLRSSIEQAEAMQEQLKKDLEAHKKDENDAKAAMSEATSIREKEAAAQAKANADFKANIGALGKAIAAVGGGMGTDFLQSQSADKLRSLIPKMQNIDDADKSEIMAFLSAEEGDSYAPQSGEILGILKQLKDEMQADKKDGQETEATSVKEYEDLMSAKSKEVQALLKMTEKKLTRSGEVAVNIVQMKNDEEDTSESLADNEKFVEELATSCKTKTGEYEQHVKTRTDEGVAIAETIKILNDDDALELFKKTLPSSAAVFLQVPVTSKAMRKRALGMVKQMRKGAPSGHRTKLDFIALALHGKKIGFASIIQMIDDLAANLEAEQKDDDNKKEYCDADMDKAEDKQKKLERDISDLKTVVAESADGIATVTDEIKKLKEGITGLDKAVEDATAQRKEQHEVHVQLMAENSAAKELLGFATNRLNKFYNPKLYNPPAKEEFGNREDRIADNFGVAFAQTSSETQDDDAQQPGPMPETGSYEKNHEGSNGAVAMIRILVTDLEKDMAESDQEEKDAQADYENMMKDSATKRADDSKMLTDKESVKAQTKAKQEDAQKDARSASANLKSTVEYVQELHSECDWLLQNFDVRKSARAGEADSLNKAKAVLSGADYS